MDTTLFLVVFLGYFIGWIFYFVNFEFQKEVFFAWARKTVLAALFFHAFFLAAFFWRGQVPAPANLTEYAVPLLIVLISLFMEWRYGARFLMLFSLPIVLLISLLAIIRSGQAPDVALSTDSGWFWFHIGFILTGLAGLLTAGSSAVMYLLQSSQLKSKHLGNIFLKLPSLDTLDRIHFRSLVWGVVLFSLGILSGLFWAENLKELGQLSQDPKVLLSFLTCAMYWVILSLRLSALRRGHKIVVGTVFIFALLVLTLVSSYYAPAGFHRGF